MNGGWSLLDLTSRLLEHSEREIVLGDLKENGDSLWPAVMAIIGLALRREAVQWRSWRPWFAAFGVALPSSYLLMAASVTVTWSYMRLLCPDLLAQASLSKPSAVLVLLWQGFLLIGWSWTGGFIVGSLSRGTLWASALLCYLPCLRCLWLFRIDSFSRFCLLLFLLPAIWGARRGLRIGGVGRTSALITALSLTVLMLPTWSQGRWHWWGLHPWSWNWALILPAWYLVLAARKETRYCAASGSETTIK